MANPRKKLLPWGIGKAIDSIQKLDDRGLLYFMDYKANYYKLEKYAAMIADSKPGCSTFTCKNNDNEVLMGRNYDFNHYRYNKKGDTKDITSLILIVKTKNWKAKYKTIGVIDGFWLDNAKGTFFENVPSDGKTDMTRLAMAPFIIMDGINEVGLATSIMHLPTENDWQVIDYREVDSLDEKEKAIAIIYDKEGQVPDRYDYKVKNNALCINTKDHKTWKANKNLAVNQNEEGKKSILHPILMRRMLDYCKNVDEAIELAKSFNLKSPLPDNDYHIMVADKSGRTVVLEWVNNVMNVVESNHGTNYYLSRKDNYGYGQDRDAVLVEELNKKQTMDEKDVLALCEKVAQNPYKKQYVGFTQWSSVYNLNKKSLKLCIFLDYDKQYEYTI